MQVSIGELEKLTGMSRTALRFYDTEGLVAPERLENGYRMYSEQDLMSLVQLRQLSAFGVELSELPRMDNRVTCREIHGTLVKKEQEIERQIEELYQKLARLQLHVDAYQTCLNEETPVTEGRMTGAYRLFYEKVRNHPGAEVIVRRWIGAAPYRYSVIRISKNALFLPETGVCPSEMGIGLLGSAFHRMQEVLEEPMEYTPPSKCLQGVIRVKDLRQIPVRLLMPFRAMIEQRCVIPLSDFYGWVVYAPVSHRDDCFSVSLRIGID